MANFPGTAGDDIIDGTATADTIADGGAGNDTLNGGDGDDVITSSGGTDSIDGGAGTDRLVINVPTGTSVAGSAVTGIGSGAFNIGGTLLTYRNIEGITYNGSVGSETVNFGVGNHNITLRGGQNEVYLADGNSTIDGGPSADTVFLDSVSAAISLSSAGVVTGTTFNGTFINVELVTGTAFDDTLVGSNITTELSGGDGNDILDSGTATGRILLIGGNGDDIFVVRSSGTVAFVIGGSDRLGHDRVETDRASFTLPNGIEDLEYFGGDAFTGTGNGDANVIVGVAMGDTLTGLGGDDTLGGEGGNDILDGGNGNDRLVGGTGVDTMNGGANNDILVVDSNLDIANGGDGIDTVQFTQQTLAYTAQADVENFSNFSGLSQVEATLNALDNIYGGASNRDTISGGGGTDSLYGRGGSDILRGDDGNDRLFGEAGQDQLFGGTGADLIYGGADLDTLRGDDGNDTLYGEADSDTLIGGDGVDLLHGGAGADLFVFDSLSHSGATLATADRILDFSRSQGDRIILSGIDAITQGSDDSFTFIGSTAFTNVAGQLRAVVSGNQTLVSGDVNGDGVADFLIRVDGIHTLTVGDFGI